MTIHDLKIQNVALQCAEEIAGGHMYELLKAYKAHDRSLAGIHTRLLRQCADSTSNQAIRYAANEAEKALSEWGTPVEVYRRRLEAIPGSDGQRRQRFFIEGRAA